METLFSSVLSDSLTLGGLLASLGTALALGFCISLLFLLTHRAQAQTAGFAISLIMLPAIISVIILLIGSNVARAFSLAGAFSLIRFRSAPGDPKDISYVFFALGVGLACGMGYLAYAAVFAAVICMVLALLHAVRFASPRTVPMQLKITVPEDLNFQRLFDDLLDEYTDDWRLQRVKTKDFGTLFELSYAIRPKAKSDPKQFIDALRRRNGNLNISLTVREFDEGA